MRTKAKLLALRYAGIKELIVRRTYPELVNNHINILRKELLGVATYNDKDKVLKFGNGSTINAAYNPYIHTSRTPLNDQFSSAWNRPELVTVEVEVPVSELTSGYHAEKAKLFRKARKEMAA